jgi:hypothetical protein
MKEQRQIDNTKVGVREMSEAREKRQIHDRELKEVRDM